jgi:hypothetical protein
MFFSTSIYFFISALIFLKVDEHILSPCKASADLFFSLRHPAACTCPEPEQGVPVVAKMANFPDKGIWNSPSFRSTFP